MPKTLVVDKIYIDPDECDGEQDGEPFIYCMDCGNELFNGDPYVNEPMTEISKRAVSPVHTGCAATNHYSIDWGNND